MWKRIAPEVQKTKKKSHFEATVGCCNQHATTPYNTESMISKDCDSSVAKLILRDVIFSTAEHQKL